MYEQQTVLYSGDKGVVIAVFSHETEIKSLELSECGLLHLGRMQKIEALINFDVGRNGCRNSRLAREIRLQQSIVPDRAHHAIGTQRLLGDIG